MDEDVIAGVVEDGIVDCHKRLAAAHRRLELPEYEVQEIGRFRLGSLDYRVSFLQNIYVVRFFDSSDNLIYKLNFFEYLAPLTLFLLSYLILP